MPLREKCQDFSILFKIVEEKFLDASETKSKNIIFNILIYVYEAIISPKLLIIFIFSITFPELLFF